MHDPQKNWSLLQRVASECGIECLGVTDTGLSHCKTHLNDWLNNGMHGDMDYMARHGENRLDANAILPGATRIVSVRINYLAPSFLEGQTSTQAMEGALQNVLHGKPYISLYARGRDYHKVIRNRLARLAKRMQEYTGPFRFRVACDSAPTPEVEIARKAGLGWRGKHSLLLHPDRGSLFFLGEIFTDLPLPASPPFDKQHCGQCRACMDICPTQAIVKEGVVDARRCISYLTIEHKGAIPVEFRQAIGSRLYGCDDCQLACPWNKFAQAATEADFEPRNGFEKPALAGISWAGTRPLFKKTEGMAMRRIGFERFARNVAVVAGNVGPHESAEAVLQLESALHALLARCSALVAEHVHWALGRLATASRSAGE
ncbi:MAG: tRNA epoxyqueuosine(34) reductase QueG [Limnobacter sp.]|nr:tRNA epoxyqueuosine(34) reductase QueG [Limnobacter sp.]